MQTTFPTLYKKSSTGAILLWRISVDGNTIITEHGQKDGAIQTATDIISEGKNAEKANATTPETQAIAEAQAKWTKQKKKGYVESLESAKAGIIDSVIEGGINPMLAHKYSEHSKKIKFPCFMQPKYDGARLIAVVKDGKCTLWTRTRKPVNSLPHIVKQIESLVSLKKIGNIVFDGEIFSKEKTFEEIISIYRQDNPDVNHNTLSYFIYDVADTNMAFSERSARLTDTLDIKGADTKNIVLVPTQKVENIEDVESYFQKSIDDGYEGAMIRNADAVYEYRRSYSLQKIKEMMDQEFKIVDVVSGRGKMADKAIFVCETESKHPFNVKMKGSMDKLSDYFSNPETVIGEQLTVRFQNLTADGIPRFPVGVRIRESKDY